MIKHYAKNDCYKCRLCKRVIKIQEQYIEDRRNIKDRNGQAVIDVTWMHVSCIMEICGEEIAPGHVWKTKEEIEVDDFLSWVRQMTAEGKSLLDA